MQEEIERCKFCGVYPGQIHGRECPKRKDRQPEGNANKKSRSYQLNRAGVTGGFKN